MPGGIFNRTSRGTNKLIQDGAKLVTCATDILEELNLEMVAKRTEAQLALPDDASERRVLEALGRDPISMDDVVRRTNLAASVVACGEVIQLERGQGVGPLPLCAPTPVAALAPPAPAPARASDLRLAEHAPAPREAAWRLAPKTSPPGR